MYNMPVDVTLSISQARSDLPALVDRVIEGDEVTITRHGRPVAVLIRPDALRPRRSTPSVEQAEHLRRALEEGRATTLSAVGEIDPQRADELVEDVRRGRARR